MSIPRRIVPLFLFAFAKLFAAEPPPDAVFVGGKVLTVDPQFSIAEAFAVRAGRVVATGTSAVIRALAAPGRTPVYELGGRMVYLVISVVYIVNPILYYNNFNNK